MFDRLVPEWVEKGVNLLWKYTKFHDRGARPQTLPNSTKKDSKKDQNRVYLNMLLAVK